jgi:NitT/TauT family transport system ATP-binding protein
MTDQDSCTNAIELRQITKSFDADRPPLYRDFSLSIEAGKSTAIVGPSGCGKSTLLNMIALALAPDNGEVLIDGRSCTTSQFGSLPISYIFQKDALIPWESVLDNTLLGAACRGSVTSDLQQKARAFLGLVGLQGHEDYYPRMLSGGQRQLVALIQNLLTEPDILILDEPFAHLDFQTKLLLEADLLAAIRLTRSKRARPMTVILVTHDLEEAIVIADRIVVVGRHPQQSVEIACDFGVPIPDLERDPARVRESAEMRVLFHSTWSAIKTYVPDRDRAVSF